MTERRDTTIAYHIYVIGGCLVNPILRLVYTIVWWSVDYLVSNLLQVYPPLTTIIEWTWLLSVRVDISNHNPSPPSVEISRYCFSVDNVDLRVDAERMKTNLARCASHPPREAVVG